MIFTISGKEYETKFNIGDRVYGVLYKQTSVICPKCKGNGYYYNSKVTGNVETCDHCNGNGTKNIYKYVADNTPLMIKAITFDITQSGLKFYYIAEENTPFGFKMSSQENEEKIFATFKEAEKYCEEHNINKKIINLTDIIIQPSFLETYPSSKKIAERMDELKVYGTFKNLIEVDINNVLVDGYTTYVLAKGLGFDDIEVIVRENTCI